MSRAIQHSALIAANDLSDDDDVLAAFFIY